MDVNLLRDRYRVDLAGLQAACEANYARLMRLLPQMREAQASRRVALSQGEHLLGCWRWTWWRHAPTPPR